MRSEAFQEKLVRTLILVFVFFALALIVVSSPASAGERHVSVGVHVGAPGGGISVGYTHHHGRVDVRPPYHRHYPRPVRYLPRRPYPRPAVFVVPRRIAWVDVEPYAPYYAGRVWVGAHRHYHRVYDFPLWVNGALTYQAHSYCGDGLYVVGDLAWDGGYVGVRYGY